MKISWTFKYGQTLLFFLLASFFSFAQDPGFETELYARPERSNYTETSTHADVLAFAQKLAAQSPFVHLEIMGTSYEGKDLPLLILANPKIENPQEAIDSGKPVFYIQGNIHGGEVEGKEALMILMREIAFEQKTSLLENQILAICPIFNPDGNDNLGPNNRGNQDGSPYLAGRRANGQGYDLNRDGLKLETIEGKALAKNVMARWDPLMFVDLHTTNGTWHGYSITYAPGLHTAGHPAGPDYLNNELLPWVQERVLERSGHVLFDYGGFYEYPPKSYYGMYPQPRFWTNSFALKNKLAILVETFSHDHFEKRIDSNVAFLSALLEYTNTNASEIQELLDESSTAVINQIINQGGNFTKGVEFDYTSPRRKSLYVYEMQGSTRTGKKKWYSNVNVYTRMTAQKEATVPRAYVFPAALTSVADKLEEHGVIITQLENAQSLVGEEYTVTRLQNESRSYQGHYLTVLEGSFESKTREFPAGSFYVDMAQPLAFLIFYLLEPEADDGLVHWNYFDSYLKARGVGQNQVAFPVFKVTNQGTGRIDQDLEELVLRYNSDYKRLFYSGLPDGISSATLEIISATGQIVHHQKLSIHDRSGHIGLQGLRMGSYILRLSTDQGMISRQMVIRNQE